MKRIIEFSLIMMLLFWGTMAFADTTWVHVQTIDDSISWSAPGNPYIIKGGVMIDSGGTLNIEPGVEVYFDTTAENPDAGFKIYAGGKLTAIGTVTDSIIFSPRDTSWHLGNFNINGQVFFSYAVFSHMFSNWALNTNYGGALCFVNGAGLSVIDHCRFIDNFATDGGGAIGTAGIARMPIIKIYNSYFEANKSNNAGGAIEMTYCDLIIDKCTFKANSSRNGGAIEMNTSLSSVAATISNCSFIQNRAESLFSSGGAIDISNNWFVTIKNNLFYGNYSRIFGGVIFAPYSSGDFKNNIVWNNSSGSGPAINIGSMTVSYSDIQGGYPGTGNIDADPLFANPASGNFHLTCLSPCIDSGDPADSLDPDFTRKDMGAFYFHHTNGSGDANNDCRLIGGDVIYLVRYFKGLGPVPYPIWKADSNADCLIQGADVTFLVRYLRGAGNPPSKNINCINPEWSIPDTCGACVY